MPKRKGRAIKPSPKHAVEEPGAAPGSKSVVGGRGNDSSPADCGLVTSLVALERVGCSLSRVLHYYCTRQEAAYSLQYKLAVVLELHLAYGVTADLHRNS